jgi:hypothetical protein
MREMDRTRGGESVNQNILWGRAGCWLSGEAAAYVPALLSSGTTVGGLAQQQEQQ